MNASVQIKLDNTSLSRLCRLGYLDAADRDPTSIRDAVACALADRLAPQLAEADGRR